MKKRAVLFTFGDDYDIIGLGNRSVNLNSSVEGLGGVSYESRNACSRTCLRARNE